MYEAEKTRKLPELAKIEDVYRRTDFDAGRPAGGKEPTLKGHIVSKDQKPSAATPDVNVTTTLGVTNGVALGNRRASQKNEALNDIHNLDDDNVGFGKIAKPQAKNNYPMGIDLAGGTELIYIVPAPATPPPPAARPEMARNDEADFKRPAGEMNVMELQAQQLATKENQHEANVKLQSDITEERNEKELARSEREEESRENKRLSEDLAKMHGSVTRPYTDGESTYKREDSKGKADDQSDRKLKTRDPYGTYAAKPERGWRSAHIDRQVYHPCPGRHHGQSRIGRPFRYDQSRCIQRARQPIRRARIPLRGIRSRQERPWGGRRRSIEDQDAQSGRGVVARRKQRRGMG